MNVWVISPYTLFREALVVSLESLPGIIISGAAPSLPDFTNAVSEAETVLALGLLFLQPDHPSIALIRMVHPGHKVLCLAFSWTPELVRTALQAGVAGCIDADIGLDELASALRQASRGEVALSSNLQRELIMDWAAHNAPQESSYKDLSPREREVITWVCQGMSNKQIAQSLYLSVRTVENHLSNIYAKLQVNSRTEAAVIALQQGWVELPRDDR